MGVDVSLNFDLKQPINVYSLYLRSISFFSQYFLTDRLLFIR